MQKAQQIRRDIINASYEAKACHIGSALSCVDILVELFYEKKIHPTQFIFGKASGVCAYYAILADLGFFPKKQLVEYLKKYPLPSTEVPGIMHSFGSVGHALPVAVGMAFAKRDKEFHVLLSDGDLMEGSTYEAALFIGQHELDNLHVHCDDNAIIALDHTGAVLDLETAFEFFGKSIPNFHRHETVKGQGVDFMEDEVSWHYKNLTKQERDRALKQL